MSSRLQSPYPCREDSRNEFNRKMAGRLMDEVAQLLSEWDAWTTAKTVVLEEAIPVGESRGEQKDGIQFMDPDPAANLWDSLGESGDPDLLFHQYWSEPWALGKDGEEAVECCSAVEEYLLRWREISGSYLDQAAEIFDRLMEPRLEEEDEDPTCPF